MVFCNKYSYERTESNLLKTFGHGSAGSDHWKLRQQTLKSLKLSNNDGKISYRQQKTRTCCLTV